MLKMTLQLVNIIVCAIFVLGRAQISVLDVSPLFDVSSTTADVAAVITRIDAALQTIGAFVAVNVPDISENKALEAANGLFSLSKDSLDAVKIQKNGFMRGYLPFGQESGLQTYFEPKEGYSYGYKWDESPFQKKNRLHGDNIWPDVEGDWGQPVLEELFSTEITFAEKLTECISIALNNGNKTALSAFVDPGGSTSVMRLFHYFASGELADVMGANVTSTGKIVMGSSPHTDWGYLTLILQDATGGLQVQHNGKWMDVPHVPNSLVINAGDFLSMISGGRYTSPVHRVLSPRSKDRTSFVLFYYPEYKTPLKASLFSQSADNSQELNSLFTLVAPLEFNAESATNENAESLLPLTFGDYIIEKWREVKAY